MDDFAARSAMFLARGEALAALVRREENYKRVGALVAAVCATGTVMPLWDGTHHPLVLLAVALSVATAVRWLFMRVVHVVVLGPALRKVNQEHPAPAPRTTSAPPKK